jgi:polyphenol oxidase
MLSPVLSPILSKSGNRIRHAFFTRHGGVSQGLYSALNGGVGSSDDPVSVLENRRLMANHIGAEPNHFLSVWQVHSADVVVVNGPWSAERPKADALVTAIPGLALSVATADCGPILFADPGAGVIGAAHAGWQGAFKGVMENTLDAMEKLGASRSNTTVVIGPMLSQKNYEVGPEFVQRFMDQDPANQDFFKPSTKAGHAMFDLPAYNYRRLEKAGVGMIEDLGLCTYADEKRFFSYRRTTHLKEPDYGRLISAIMLKPKL